MSAETFEEVLEHFGVKGMRWGIRKARKSAADSASRPEGSSVPTFPQPKGASKGKPTPVELKIKAGKKIQARGGKNQPVTQDAIYAAYLRQKAKGSGHQALNNAEMRALLDRQGLEERFMKAYPKDPTKIDLGKKYSMALLKSPLADVAMSAAVGKYGGNKSPLARNGLMVAKMILVASKPSRASQKKDDKEKASASSTPSSSGSTKTSNKTGYGPYTFNPNPEWLRAQGRLA